MTERKTWTAALRALGDAVFDLWSVEIEALRRDLVRFALQVAKLLGIALGFLFVAFYLPFLLILAAVDGVRVATGNLWSASLLVFLGVVLVMAIVAGIAWLLIGRKMENPVDTVNRRLEDHRGWWRTQISGDEPRRLDDHQEEPA